MRVLAAIGLATLLSSAAAPLAVDSAWIRAAPPGAVVLAGYATLRNDGDAPLEITGAGSDAFARVEIHEMTMRDGVMRMRALERVVVPPRATLELAPGGTHLMLHEPRRAVAPGDTVVIEWRTADGARAATTFEVRAP